MESRILFLGTSGDSFVTGKQYRSSGGIILNIESEQVHIDPGPGSLLMAKMMGVNLRENTALFVSKNSLLRANDVNAVISAMTHDGLDKRGVLVCPSSVASESMADEPYLNKRYKEFLEKTIIIDNTKRMAINQIELEIVALKNYVGSAACIKFITQKFTLAYVPDIADYTDIEDSLKNTDILILSVVDPKNFKRKEYVNSEDAQKLINSVKPQLAVITGFGIKMLQAEPLYEAREIQRNTGTQVIAAKDGMTINPVSFSATVRQKNLNSY